MYVRFSQPQSSNRNKQTKVLAKRTHTQQMEKISPKPLSLRSSWNTIGTRTMRDTRHTAYIRSVTSNLLYLCLLPWPARLPARIKRKRRVEKTTRNYSNWISNTFAFKINLVLSLSSPSLIVRRRPDDDVGGRHAAKSQRPSDGRKRNNIFVA